MSRPAFSRVAPLILASLLVLALDESAQSQCPCPGDMDQNQNIDGRDILCFTSCLVGGGAGCPDCTCADLDPNNVLNSNDIPPFVTLLLNGPFTCPPIQQQQYEPGPWHTPPASPCGESRSCGGRPDADVIHTAYFFSGEFYLEAVDLRIAGRGLDFVWSRKYRSRFGPNTAMGNGWDFSYNIYIEQVGPDLLLHDGNSRQDLYPLQTNGKWARNEFFREIQQNGDGTYSLIFADTGKWNFNPFGAVPTSGKIASLVDRNGNSMVFSYDAQGRLQTITDSLIRQIQVAYNANNLISTVTDFTGRQIVYTYYQNGDAGGGASDLKSVRSPIVFPAG